MGEKPLGLQHPECYARALGRCSREMSGEHYVSKSILELIENRAGQRSKSVRVTGLSFQKPGALQQLGISSLVGNILCKTHNSLLSPFDEAGKAMFLAMDGMNDGAAGPSLPERFLRVDGDGLERWVLKTMCGGLFSGAFKVSPTETMKGLCPPQGWLDILFNGAAMPPGQGLYYMPRKPGETVTADEYVLRLEPIGSRDSNQIGALRVWFLGFEFILLMGNLMPGVPTMFDGALYRPAGLRTMGSGTSVRLDWKDGARSDEIMFGLANGTGSRSAGGPGSRRKAIPMDPKKVIMTKQIEPDLDLYKMFYDHPWAESLVRKVAATKLEPAVENLCVSWKEASNTHRLPWLMITQMEAFVSTYVKEHRPYGMRLIDHLKVRLTRDLGDSLRHMQKKKIDEVLEKIDSDFRAGEKDHDITIEPRRYWSMLLQQEEFQSSIWGSQNLAYCALTFAYEWFVVSCFRLMGGPEKARPSDDKFWTTFQSLLSRDPRPDYWDDRPVKIARLTRNCFAHTGGKAKQDLLDEKPALFISSEGMITIQPSDTRELFDVLKDKVTKLVDEVIPKLPV